MSLATPFRDGTINFRTGANRNSFVSAVTEGFTRTSPLTSLPRSSASRSARHAPIDRPITKISSVAGRSSSKARSISAYQSSQRVLFISCQLVPCPGNLGRLTVSPAAARYSAHGRSDCGLPVNPWQSSTPVCPPSWRYASAPGSTGMSLILPRGLIESGLRRLLNPVPESSHVCPTATCSTDRQVRKVRMATGAWNHGTHVLLGGQGDTGANIAAALQAVGGGH